MLDLGRRQGAAGSDVGASAAGLGATAAGGLSRHVQDVQFAARGGLDGVFDGWVVADMVPIHDVVVPVSLAELQHGGLEPELAYPGPGLVLGGERQLAGVVVPGADEVDGLDVGRGPEGELELDGGHGE